MLVWLCFVRSQQSVYLVWLVYRGTLVLPHNGDNYLILKLIEVQYLGLLWTGGLLQELQTLHSCFQVESWVSHQCMHPSLFAPCHQLNNLGKLLDIDKLPLFSWSEVSPCHTSRTDSWWCFGQCPYLCVISLDHPHANAKCTASNWLTCQPHSDQMDRLWSPSL